MRRTKMKPTKGFKANPPAILVWKGQQSWQEPRFEVRYFHRKRMEVWSGYVRTSDIQGWAENVRIQFFVDKWKRDHDGGVPSNDDILDWMLRDYNELSDKKPEFELPSLAESIVKNGVRQPIVLTSDGVLLDGNRRYFAALMKFREAEKNGDETVMTMVRHLPAYVLGPLCTQVDFDSVLVEENFVDDCRKPWPNFIKASKVFEGYKALQEKNFPRIEAFEELAKQFGLKKSHVERFIKMMNFIEEFHSYHISEDEETGRQPKDEYDIKWRAQKYFEYFDELTKPQVFRILETEPELRSKVFERLYDGDFVNFTQIRKIPDINADRRARDKFMTETGSDAVKNAIEWVNVAGVARKALTNNDRVTSFKRFLDSLTAQEIESLDPVAVNELEEIAQKVARMAAAIQTPAEAK